MFKRFALATGLALLAAGCIRTQEMPLAPNVVRLDTQASGLLFVGQTTEQTMRRAAQITLENGYTHFRFDQAQVAQGRELSGVYTSGSATMVGSASGTRIGTTVYANGSGVASGYATSTPIYKPTSSVGVTVYMFHPNEPGATNAFDAQQVLAKYGS